MPLLLTTNEALSTQQSPTIYLIFWGPQWVQANKLSAVYTAVMDSQTSLYTALSKNANANAQAYNNVLQEYLLPGTTVPQFDPTNNVWTDATAPPKSLTAASFIPEIVRAVNAHQKPNWPGTPWQAGKDVQFMIFPESGIPTSVSGEKPDKCAYHNFSMGTVVGSVVFDVEYWLGPWVGKNGTGYQRCDVAGGKAKSNTALVAQAMTMLSTHEYAEAATDPFWSNAHGYAGWKTTQLQEISDLCQYYPAHDLAGVGFVAFQWSNQTSAIFPRKGCVIGEPTELPPF